MNPFKFNFDAIGTKWQIQIDDLGSENTEVLIQKIKSRVEEFEQNYSRFRGDSLLAKMSRHPGVYPLPEDAVPLLSLYQNLYQLTSGAFTPLIGQTLIEAGYDPDYSLQPKELHQLPSWEEVLDFDPAAKQLAIKKTVQLDFGAAGKGYIIDLVGELLRQNNIRSFSIFAGGDILHRSQENNSIRVGLENPGDISQVIGVATISNRSICGSSGNRRKWADFHHIISPHTLSSPKNILATWVIAKSTMLADALATCLFFVPPAHLSAQYHFDYLIILDDYSFASSPNFPATIFSK